MEEKLRKAQIRQEIKESIEKWEKVKVYKSGKNKKSFFHKFWNSCGYCDQFSCHIRPFSCPLTVRKSTRLGIVYCFHWFERESVASLALQAGDKGDHPRLLNYANILIAKMKRDLKKYS